MTLAIFIFATSILALAFIRYHSVGRSLELRRATEVGNRIRPVDIAAFRNLVEPAEREYLRQNLPPGDFRVVQRARLRATAAYIQQAAQNASLLIRVGQAALAAGDPRTMQAARELVNNALLVRRNAALVQTRIYLAMVWPRGTLSATTILESYQQLNGSAMLLGRLHNPAAPIRLSRM